MAHFAQGLQSCSYQYSWMRTLIQDLARRIGLVNTLQPDGRLIIGGSFQKYSNIPAGRIARLTGAGALDNRFNTSTGIVSNVVGVMSIDLQQDGKIIAGGKFDNFNGITVSNVVRLQSNGQLDAQIITEAINAQIESVFVFPRGKIIIQAGLQLLALLSTTELPA